MEGVPQVEDDDSDDVVVKPALPKSKPSADKSESYKFFAFDSKKSESTPKAVDELEKPEPTKSEADNSPVEAIIPAAESEAPLEELGEIERPVIERELTIAAVQADAEQAKPAPTNPEDAAAEQAVEHFRSLIVEDGEDSEAAYKATMAELGAETEDIQDAEEESESGFDDQPQAIEADMFGDEQDEQIVFDRSSENSAAEDDDTSSGSGSSSGGGRPPAPPVPPSGTPTGGGWPQMPNFGRNFVPRTPDAQPQPENYYRGNPATSALIGGIIGYLIGRRRGRIRTEKKLLPIQKRLEKQVYDLDWELKKKESSLRRVAAEKVRTNGPAVIEKLSPNVDTPSKKPEHIGHVLISTADMESAKAAEKNKVERDKAKLAEKVGLPTAGKRVENLSREELLGLSEKIVIEGSTLRQIYETRLVGERGLRRLVAEHLRGGDLKRALRREIVEREIDFERDPALRDYVPQASASTGGGKGSAALDELLKAANVDVADNGEEIAFFRARARYEATQLHKHQQQRQMINLGFASIIAVLALAILALYLSRG